jgi:hypothetical protein
MSAQGPIQRFEHTKLRIGEKKVLNKCFTKTLVDYITSVGFMKPAMVEPSYD